MATPRSFDTRIMDHPGGYGLVSRFFHWLVVLLMLNQIVSALARHWFDDTPFGDAMFSLHVPVGVTILIVTIARIAWALANSAKRPAHGEGLEKLAGYGHGAIYALLVLVPTLAILRNYGSGRGWSIFGLQIFDQTGAEIGWLTALGSAFHGELGYVLFAVIVGHAAMAIIHDRILYQNILARMTTGRGQI
ncbi:cytochrome b [Fulvimarina sp. 2208YS6-2-32]|uniref:Cytochrome b n=1 Tax=Fulvimarina uroteuthidis TaxID=3098149 RepID=A0ABU5I6F2_9HYPH|nr:cytochrome b [Fulvimarina sp. 2208YS6-2-32]MDY8110667.1 cytochrome b [Fulvimarina sp. 2208YS6-2-32]